MSGSVLDGKVVGNITDKYIDFIDYLAGWGFKYDINDKLNATYVINSGTTTPIQLKQDGSFEFEVGSDYNNDPIVISVQDAAGNSADLFVINGYDVETTEETTEEVVIEEETVTTEESIVEEATTEETTEEAVIEEETVTTEESIVEEVTIEETTEEVVIEEETVTTE